MRQRILQMILPPLLSTTNLPHYQVVDGGVKVC
ncbi:MAG: hypothetical protein QOH71_1642 [Blastocatellia bacterium]|jgi:hypothetical protein|nr:hypothetical protein [Blastocatellia bacterium]